MVTEKFTVVALPHSKAEDADFHVSLFISPQLTPDKAEGRLDEFEVFVDWAGIVKKVGGIELSDQMGVIEAEALLDEIDGEAWVDVFPKDTPVRRPVAPDWSERHWRTFDAGAVHNAGKAFHLLPLFTSPTSPPLPSAHPIGRLLSQWVGTRDTPWDESVVTRGLDLVLGEGDGEGGPPRRRLPLQVIERNLDSAEPMGKAILEVHRARRFYERPESALPYQDRPSENPVVEEVPRPDPDFHERCTFVSDHPALQRRLGLVIDLRVLDPSRLADSTHLTASIDVDGDPSLCRTTRTRCEAVGDDLVTVGASEDWHQGALRLGDVGTFAVLDMDPDGTALKLDRYLWALPRLVAMEDEGTPTRAAPTALRSIGFTVARRKKALTTQDRMTRQQEIADGIDKQPAPLLGTEDVTRGMRVEVWDDESTAWRSLHARRIDAAVHKGNDIVEDLGEEGFIQGTTATETVGAEDSPVHVHEAMFGWDGWSLAAPRPGRRVRHEDGEEIVEETVVEADPVTPLVVTNRVEPGTLPRLRYGRSYAFRAWSVDLAGNSRPHQLGKTPSPDDPLTDAVSAMLPAAPPAGDPALLSVVRGAAAAQVIVSRASLADRAPSDPVYLDRIPEPVLHHLRLRRGATPVRSVDASRAATVERAFGDAVLSDDSPYMVNTARLDPRVVIRPGGGMPTLEEVATVSPPRPFLRWDPVAPPVVVARHELSTGESLRQVVIRSGVSQDVRTLEITVTPPSAYAGENDDLGYRASSERHLVPPKTSQSEAELHGAFDTAIGSTDANRHNVMLAVALRESGTLFDKTVPRLDDPHLSDLQPGIDLASEPSVPESERKTLPLDPGEPPAPGQYVVHDVDELAIPYLPDVAARGISLVFPDAGRDRKILFPFGTEGFTAAYRGSWPVPRPFRIELEGSAILEGRLTGGEIRVGLPPGDVQRFRLWSSLSRADLDLFGLWRILPPILTNNDDVAEAAADGWLWALTPADEVTLVHAVPRPLEAPRPTALNPARPGEGSTEVTFFGAVDVHGPSTEQLTAEASWEDPVDDLSQDGPSTQSFGAVAFTTRIREEEDLAVLFPAPPVTQPPQPAPPQDVEVNVPGFGPVWVHGVRQQLGDTRHHLIDYRFRASTRFREYFDVASLSPVPIVIDPDDPDDSNLPVDDGQSVVGPLTTLSIPSSARPAAPIVHSVLPLLRWDEGTEPEQPVALRSRRRGGVRIYLERPWYSSGAGELLAVLLAPAANDSALGNLISQWGADPVWVGQPVPNRAMFLELDSLMRTLGLDDRPGDAMPVAGPVNLPLPGTDFRVTVLGYLPQYNAERQLWYVDVAIEPGSKMWPFLRLSVARYQPDSIAGCHLSPQVLCNFVQLTPERTASVSRTDVRHVRVVVSGPVGVRPELLEPQFPMVQPGVAFPQNPLQLRAWVRQNRLMVARLQRRDPEIDTDLGWETVDVAELDVRGTGEDMFEAAWVGSLAAPVNIPLRRPGADSNWRVTIEEWERLPGDPADLSQTRGGPVWEQRLVYADTIGL
jgi:hypothetical protein